MPRLLQILLAAALALGGCVEISIPENISLLPSGTVIILQGQADEPDSGCRTWTSELGLSFVLFQTIRISNDDFDAVVAPGARSRLELQVRTDLGDPCGEDVIYANITRVLDIEQDVTRSGTAGQ